MAGNKGAIIGIGIIGISALAWMSMKQPSATTNGELTPGGVPSYTDESDSSSGDNDWDAPDCSLAWDSSGNRVSNTWVSHGRLDMGPMTRSMCDLQGFRIRVYTDKRVYIAGEPIKVLFIKSYFENSGLKNEWRKWDTKTKAFGDTMSVMLGIKSTDGADLWRYQRTMGSKKSKDSVKSIGWNGDLKADGWISTSNTDVGQYELSFAGELGPYEWEGYGYQTCGASDCLHGGSKGECNNRKATSTKLITILPRDCSSPSSAESYKSESKVDLNAEHFIQSYVNNWM